MKWIPVEKSMPKTHKGGFSDTVIVTVSNLVDDFHVVRTDRYDDNIGGWEAHPYKNDSAKVTAWMPLPSPYQPNRQ